MPRMPAFPKERVFPSTPYKYTGIDYLGPLYVKTETGYKKVWVHVCLYTCMVTRAVHLELMLDMTSEQFLMGLRRFIARWGKPSEILSDKSMPQYLS